MRKSKGCQWNRSFQIEVCSTAEIYKNDPLSEKLTKEQFTTSSQLQLLKWQVVKALALSDDSKHGLLGFKYITKGKMLNLERGGEEVFVLLLRWDGTSGSKETENWWRQREGEGKGDQQWHSCILTALATAIFSQIVPWSWRNLRSLERKDGGKQLIWNNSEAGLWLSSLYFFFFYL